MSFYYPALVLLFIPLYLLYRADASTKQRSKKLLYLSLLFGIIALMRPVIEESPNQESIDAKEYIIALDASFSMLADDIAPTRFDAAKASAKELMKKLPHDRFSLFVFTSNALLIAPPTTDTSISLMALDAIEPNYILTKGTSLKALLQSVAKLSDESKKLIIYSDGGEEKELSELVSLAKEAKITPFVIATTSQKGALLKQGTKPLLDANGNLVISRTNPILKPFVSQTNGALFSITEHNLEASIIAALQANSAQSKRLTTTLKSYTELFYYPLLLALFCFVIALTTLASKLQKLLLFVLFMLSSQLKAESLLDFYYIDKATKHYKEQNYPQALDAFSAITPSPQSYYNKALTLYRLTRYKDAAKTLAAIKTQDVALKEKILFMLGNTAVKLHKYDKAKLYYKKALALKEDSAALQNLLQLYALELQEKKELYQSLPKTKQNQRSGASEKKESTKKGQSKKSAQGSHAKSSTKAGKAKNKQHAQRKRATQEAKKYKFGYKAYELINKGYTDEKHPW